MKRFLVFCLFISAPVSADEVILICKWDDTAEHETLRLYGQGRHVIEQGRGKDIIEHHSDEIITQEAWVLRKDGDSRGKGGIYDPKFIYWSFQVNRYTGRLEYFDESGSTRIGNCKKAETPLF